MKTVSPARAIHYPLSLCTGCVLILTNSSLKCIPWPCRLYGRDPATLQRAVPAAPRGWAERGCGHGDCCYTHIWGMTGTSGVKPSPGELRSLIGSREVGTVAWPCSLLLALPQHQQCISNQAKRILLVLGREHRDQHGTKECLGSPSHQHPWEERPQGEQPKKEKKTASRVIRHLHCLFHGLADQPFCNQITLLSNCKIN